MTASQHGGPRLNAGRPAIDPRGDTQRITVRLTTDQIAWLNQHASGNLSDALRAVIEAARQAERTGD